MKVFASALLGYRVWTVRDQQLYPVWFDSSPWQPGENHSICCFHAHTESITGCQCGFYAYHSLTRAAFARATSPRNHPVVIGAVAGRGSSQIYHHGWRALEAQVIALYRYQPEADEVSSRYRVPLFTSDQELEQSVYPEVCLAPSSLIPSLVCR